MFGNNWNVVETANLSLSKPAFVNVSSLPFRVQYGLAFMYEAYMSSRVWTNVCHAFKV